MALDSFTCSTRDSTTQIEARMLRMWLVVQDISPWKTEYCWVISRDENAKPPTSIQYLARSPSSIFRASRNII